MKHVERSGRIMDLITTDVKVTENKANVEVRFSLEHATKAQRGVEV